MDVVIKADNAFAVVTFSSLVILSAKTAGHQMGLMATAINDNGHLVISLPSGAVTGRTSGPVCERTRGSTAGTTTQKYRNISPTLL